MFFRRLMQKLFAVRRPHRRRSAVRSELLEDRTLLSNLNLINASGTVNDRIVLGGGAEVNNFVVSYNPGTGVYRFEDTSGTAINAIGGLAGLDTNPAANIVEFHAPTAEGVTDFVRIEINPNAGDDTVIINGFRAGDEGLVIHDDASEGNDTVTINGDIGSAGSRVSGNNVLINGETINFSGSVFTDNLDVSVRSGAGGINIAGSPHIDVGTGTVTFEGTVDGAGDLGVVGDFIDFLDVVGGTTPLNSLTATGATVRTQDAVTVDGGDMIFQADLYIPQGNLNGTADLVIRRNTAGPRNITTTSFNFIQPGFNSVTIGSSLTTTLSLGDDGNDDLLTGSLDVGAPLILIGQDIVIGDSIQQGTHTVTFRPENSINFSGVGGAVGTGDSFIEKQTMGGTLTVVANTGSSWGNNHLSLSAPGATVTFEREVGPNFGAFSATADTLNFNFISAVVAQGDVTLNANTINLNGGIFSTAGSVDVTGNLNLAGNILFRVAGGQSVSVVGDVTGGGNVLVRGVGGAIDTVTFNGNVNIGGNFQIDSSGGSTAANVDLASVSASNIVVRGLDIDLLGGAIASTSNVQLIGPVDVVGTTSIASGGAADQYVQLTGAVTSAGADLTVNSGGGRTQFGAAVTGLNNLTVTSGGTNFIIAPINIAGNIQWTVGVNGNGLNDRLIRSGAGSIVAAGGFLEADVLQGFTSGTNVSAAVTLTQRGAGN
ncbi:MAG: hypothetical protein KDA58_01965 [Planctomycetaceae bacterium]|nr:hypothetical protein [Planctomycetaceae bacterium]